MAPGTQGDPIIPTGSDFYDDPIPENIQDDTLIQFFRCRYEKRDALYHSFTPEQQDRIKREILRIKRLRNNLSSSKDNLPIQDLERYRAKWKAQAMDESNIKKAENEAHAKIAYIGGKSILSDGDKKIKRRKLDELRILEAVRSWKITADTPQPGDGNLEDPGYDFTVSQITLTKSDPNENLHSFGNYQIKQHPLHKIIHEKYDNPLMEECPPNTVRYFHLPANNMVWIEEAIARYYNEDRGEYDYRKSPDYRVKSSNILCREFWTAQQHGGRNDPIHARHMRSKCSDISRGPCKGTTGEDQPREMIGGKNFVIFMPYLHWETDRRRRKMAEVIKEETKRFKNSLPHVNGRPSDEIVEAIRQCKIKFGARVPTELRARRNQPQAPNSYWGKYMMQAAKVYDAMDIEPDVRVLRENLYSNPPLHGRRTLDQSYYWKLENTEPRDEDQVVYRGTRAGKDIGRTTRVTMVDQLWLYVLDENTIISSFPRRWGRNKPDYSGVHKCIRQRLEHIRDGEIQSVYDLALLIMNQCSTVFFDRTKPVDDRPEVLDIFANAIGSVSELKTIAFEGFWRHLQKLNASNIHELDMEATARTYLNINPEGELLREAHDIIDELRMMTRIYNHQLHVAEAFHKSLQSLNEQDTPEKGLLSQMKQIVSLLDQPQNGSVSRHSRASSDVSSLNFSSSKQIPEATLQNAADLIASITLRRNELQDLENNTREISDQLRDLLSLKQQQASIIEAKYALERADESVSQGRKLTLFTIITIIFLPLSFMSSVFGMNSSELSGSNGGLMSLRHQFTFMFPISLAVITISLGLAFSDWIRGLISLLVTISWAAVSEYSGLQYLWKLCTNNRDAKGLREMKLEWKRKIYGRRERKMVRDALDKAKENPSKKELRQDSLEVANINGHGDDIEMDRITSGKSISKGWRRKFRKRGPRSPA
ncbi:hypothetical protein B7494_g3667 [Chlorociboria aeruginascens]|nr:hypothetical protein B7494_g3667 [Chlorociboria aeruginascens]